MADILDQIVNYNSASNLQENQKSAAVIADTLAQVKQRQSEDALREQQTKAAQLANEEHVRGLRDMNTYTEALKRNEFDPIKATQDPVFRNTVSAPGFVKINDQILANQKSTAETQKYLSDAGKTEEEKQQKELEYFGNVAAGLQDKSPAEITAALAQAGMVSPIHQKESAALIAQIQQNPAAAPLIVKHLLDASGVGRKVAGEKTKTALETSQAAAADAEKRLREAEIPGKKTAADLDQLKLDLMKSAQTNPQQGAALIDTALPASLDPQANSSFKAAYQAALASGSPEAAARIVASAADHAAGLSPAKRQAEIDKAVDLEKATGPLKVQQAVAVEVAKARQAAGTGQIIDPTQRSQADRALEAADKEAQDKIAEAMRLKTNVEMAQSGNRVAPNLETIELLRGIVNRVNSNELRQVGASGNAIDWLKGEGGKWISGQPIPENIQKDFASIADAQLKLAQIKHATVYGTVASKYGLKDLKPPDIAGIYKQASGAANGPQTPAGAPPVGTIVDGFKFKGGNHRDKSNWEKVKP